MVNTVWLGLTTMGEPRLVLKVDSKESKALANKIVKVTGEKPFMYRDNVMYLVISESGLTGHDITNGVYTELQLVKRFDTRSFIDFNLLDYDEFMFLGFKEFIIKLREVLPADKKNFVRTIQSMFGIKMKL